MTALSICLRPCFLRKNTRFNDVSRLFLEDASNKEPGSRLPYMSQMASHLTVFGHHSVRLRLDSSGSGSKAEVSHIASQGGLPFPDCTVTMPYKFEWGKAEMIVGLVVLISSCRQLLLNFWPEFSQSSKMANQQVLGSLEIWDYIVVSFLPGISEELLFRGALLPLIGLDWKGATVAGIIFGVLHLGAGRKSAFALWASIVGIIYGFAAISSSSLIVPMVSHSLNNFLGGLLWRYYDSKQNADTVDHINSM